MPERQAPMQTKLVGRGFPSRNLAEAARKSSPYILWIVRYIQKINPAVPEWRQAGLLKGGGGANGIRTSDTRIFSPMLYQLSYGTFFIALTEFLSSLAKHYFVLAGAKVQLFPIMANFSESFFLFCSRKPMLFDVCHLMVTENIVSLRFENF